MQSPLALIRRLLADRRGATVVEYGLIIACVVLAIMGALRATGNGTGSMWDNVAAKVINAR